MPALVVNPLLSGLSVLSVRGDVTTPIAAPHLEYGALAPMLVVFWAYTCPSFTQIACASL